MPNHTTNYNMYKLDTTLGTDGKPVDSNVKFNVKTVLNDNLDIIDTALQTKPTIRLGTIAPATVPLKIGDTYIDTTLKNVYISVGTSSSSDWVKVS